MSGNDSTPERAKGFCFDDLPAAEGDVVQGDYFDAFSNELDRSNPDVMDWLDASEKVLRLLRSRWDGIPEEGSSIEEAITAAALYGFWAALNSVAKTVGGNVRATDLDTVIEETDASIGWDGLRKAVEAEASRCG